MHRTSAAPPKLPTALHLFGAQLFIIALVEGLVHFFMSGIIPDDRKYLQGIADSLLLAAASAPFVWFLVARPMRRVAMNEFSRSQTILGSIVEAVITFDREGVIESLNPAARAMFGYELHEIKGQRITLLIPTLEANADHAITQGVETFGCRKDGSSVPAEVSVSRFSLGEGLSFIAIIHDCTERKRAEEQISEQRDFSLRLIQDSAVPCFVLAPDHTVMLWNKACEELTGLKSAEMVGTDRHWQGFYEARRPVLADLIIDGNESTLSSLYGNYTRSPLAEEGLQCEGWYDNVGEKSRYLFFDAVPVRNAKGELSAVIETLADITQRKMAEEALRISEEKFYKAFHSSPVGVVINSKAEGRFIEANEAFFRMLGYSREEVIGHSSLELGLWVDPGERRRIIEQSDKEGAVRNVEVRIRIKTGETRLLLWSSDLLTLEGEQCLIITVRDVTSQKENERLLLKSKAELTVKHEQLSALFSQVETIKREWEQTLDCISDIVILLDRERRVVRCNRAMVEFVGISFENILGMEWQQLMQQPGVPLICLDERSGEVYHEPMMRWFFFTSYQYGRSGGLVITIHDTTEAKQAAMELEKAYAELKETQAQMIQQEKMASIGQIAAGIAHEINNPTGFVLSNLGTLGKYVERFVTFMRAESEVVSSLGSPDENERLSALRKQLKIDHLIGDVPSLIAESLDGAGRIKKIVDDMKKFSRMDETECQVASLTDCIESSLNIVWNELKYKVTLKKEYAELPPIRCFPQQLSQVFMNLLVNASHAIDERGEITIRTWQDNAWACIAISDTGCGIPEEISSRIFEPFFTTKAAGKGTGLGLSISSDIIKKHGGDIAVESVIDAGTTFTIKLPIDPTDGD